jgi:hypothetical protein
MLYSIVQVLKMFGVVALSRFKNVLRGLQVWWSLFPLCLID